MGCAGAPLKGRAILVVEDEFFLADDLTQILTEHGACVVGPVGDVPAGLRLLAERSRPPDAAIVDIKLRDGNSYRIAEQLSAQSVPFVFATAYDPGSVRADFRTTPFLMKPVDPRELLTSLVSLMVAKPTLPG